jgi:hypothetical protein
MTEQRHVHYHAQLAARSQELARLQHLDQLDTEDRRPDTERPAGEKGLAPAYAMHMQVEDWHSQVLLFP